MWWKIRMVLIDPSFRAPVCVQQTLRTDSSLRTGKGPLDHFHHNLRVCAALHVSDQSRSEREKEREREMLSLSFPNPLPHPSYALVCVQKRRLRCSDEILMLLLGRIMNKLVPRGQDLCITQTYIVSAHTLAYGKRAQLNAQVNVRHKDVQYKNA